ncbi:hypothetical protein BH10ACI2_BH10ACI2_15320 [soil metagenome]
MKTLRKYLALSSAIIALSIVGVNAKALAGDKPAKSVEQQIYKKLLSLPNYGVFDHIAFQVNGSSVVLTGKVYSLGTSRLAAANVKDVPGISTVVNNIEDLPPSSFDDSIRRQALRSFGSHGLGGYFWENNPDVRIIVEHGRITLEGYVYNSGDRNAMNIYANGIPGVFEVTNNLKVGSNVLR